MYSLKAVPYVGQERQIWQSDMKNLNNNNTASNSAKLVQQNFPKLIAPDCKKENTFIFGIFMHFWLFADMQIKHYGAIMSVLDNHWTFVNQILRDGSQWLWEPAVLV